MANTNDEVNLSTYTLYGSPLAIVALLDGKSWDADTLDAIAEILRNAGFEIREPEDQE